jgi:hypothetical protein
MYNDFLKTLKQEDQDRIPLENTKEMQELKQQMIVWRGRVTPLSRNQRQYQSRRQPKLFWYSWNSTKKEVDHDVRKLHTDKLGTCCFVDLIGRPQKTINDVTIDMPLVPYQKLLWQTLKEHKHIWVKKSRGLGLSTFMLYYIAYKCITEWTAGDHVVIVTGTRIETAADLIQRLKLLFKRNFPKLYSQLQQQKDTVCILNGVMVEAYPAGHTDSIRGRDRVKMVLVDEADYFGPSESKEILSVVEGFIGKPNSDPTIALISTPNRPDGLFNKIEQDQHSLYYKLFLPYQFGLEGEYPIYSKEQIEEAKKSPDFPREYEGAYLGMIGNTFSEAAIQACQKLGEELDSRPIRPDTQKAIGIDSAFGGGSNFAITTIEYLADINKFRVIQSDEYHRPHLNDMLDLIWNLKKNFGNISNIFADASAPVVWQGLKHMLGEKWSEIYMKMAMDNCKKYNILPETRMTVVPVAFSTNHKQLLQNCKFVTEYVDQDGRSLIGIHPRHTKLITSLRTAISTEYSLDKTQTSFNYVLDSYRLAVSYIKRRDR